MTDPQGSYRDRTGDRVLNERLGGTLVCVVSTDAKGLRSDIFKVFLFTGPPVEVLILNYHSHSLLSRKVSLSRELRSGQTYVLGSCVKFST